MTVPRLTRRRLWMSALWMLAFAGIASSFADEHGRPGPGYSPRGQVLDNRYHHGHFYPPRGAVVRDLPPGYRPYDFRGSRFYFSAGVWYAPGPAGFVVTRPPPGLLVTALPPFYTTVWFGGVPYYYADEVYYQWRPDLNGYVVAAAPAGAEQPSTPPPVQPREDDLYIYPRNGQSADQQAADRYECHGWARSQTGFDPTRPGGGAAGAPANGAREGYRRAMTACLEARGYSVR